MTGEQWDRLKSDAFEVHGLSERSKILGGYKLVISSEDEDEEYPIQYVMRSADRRRNTDDIEPAAECLLRVIGDIKKKMFGDNVHLYSHQDYDFFLTRAPTFISVLWVGALAPEPSPNQKRMTNLARAKLGDHETPISRDNNAGYRQALSGDSRA